MMELSEVLALVSAQTEDEGLWVIAQTATEEYLQQELRKLHEAVERLSGISDGLDS